MKPSGGGGGNGHTHKHSGTHKHHAHGAKHHPKHHLAHHHGKKSTGTHVKAHHARHPRGLAIGDLLPVCTFEAVAQSLRLAGYSVADDDMLALWDLCGQREVSIAEALAAAARFGLAGCRPVGQKCLDELDVNLGGAWPVQVAHPHELPQVLKIHSLILGVDLPGPHAVLAVPDGWWSWGRLYDPSYFPHAVIEEAWVISWQ